MTLICANFCRSMILMLLPFISISPSLKDYVNTDMPSIITASDVNSLNLTGQIYIIDIRAADDFATGHIANAINVAATDILSHIESTDLSAYSKVAVVCYSGQTAAYVTSLLRIMGHDNVFSMKFGMSAWHEDFAGSWKNSIGNTYATQFTSDATAKNEAGDMPTLSTGKTTGQEILEVRVNSVLADGFSAGAISNSEVFGNLSNYYIVNYWSESDYTSIGHIPGAIQYTPKEAIKTTTSLKTLPTDKTIIVYCWTGQTSAFLTAYLRVLGYQAKSLKFGANGMILDNLPSHQFTDAAIMNYDYTID